MIHDGHRIHTKQSILWIQIKIYLSVHIQEKEEEEKKHCKIIGTVICSVGRGICAAIKQILIKIINNDDFDDKLKLCTIYNERDKIGLRVKIGEKKITYAHIVIVVYVFI